MSYREQDIAYENPTHWVLRVKNGFEVYRIGITHSVRCAQIGYTGNEGLQRAIVIADRRHTESQAKATKGKAGTAGAPVTGPVRRSTAGIGLRVGEAGADQPATSEHMDVTAGETAPNFDIAIPALLKRDGNNTAPWMREA